jgi:hypothetical protein
LSGPITVGKNALAFQGNNFEYDPRKGNVPNYPYRGPSVLAAQLAAAYINARVPFRFAQDGPFSTITLIGNTLIDPASPSPAPVDRWDLRGNETQCDIHLHPNALAIEAAAQGALKQIDYDITQANYTGIATPRTNSAGTAITVVLPTAGSAGQFVLALKALLAQGQDHFDVIRPVLRHTYTIDDNYTGNAFNFSNAEQIYTSAQLLTECGAFPYPLPPPYVQAINSIPVLAAACYTCGWKKTPPDGNTAAKYKTEMVTEYKYDLWNTSFLYTVKV